MYENRRREIEQELLPSVEALGFDVKYTLAEEFYCVMFIRPREPGETWDWVSPVELRIFREFFCEQDDPDWYWGHIGHRQFRSFPISNSGWTCDVELFTDRTGPEHKTGDEGRAALFAELLHMLETEPLYPLGRNIPGLVNTWAIKDVWEKLEEELTERFDIADFNFVRSENGDETIAFAFSDAHIELIYPQASQTAVLRIDGEEVKTCRDDSRHVIKMVSESMIGLQYRHELW